MLKIIRLTLMCLLAVSVGAPGLAQAQTSAPPWPPSPYCREGSLPSHDPQYPSEQLTVVCIPPMWNGQLVVYAHGYVPPQVPPTLMTA